MSPSSRNNNCSVPMLPNDEQDLSMTFSSKACMQHNNNNNNINEDLYMPQHLMTPRERTLSCDSLEMPLLMMPSFDSVSYSSSHVARSSCSSRYLEIPALTATTTTTTSSPAPSTGPFFPNFESEDSRSVPALAVRLTPRIEGMQYGF